MSIVGLRIGGRDEQLRATAEHISGKVGNGVSLVKLFLSQSEVNTMDDDDNLPPPGPKQLPPHSGQPNAEPPTGSTATNGHWLHDASGPASYAGSPSQSVARLNEILGAKVPGLQCSSENGTLYIEGSVESEAQAHDLLRMVRELEPDMTVVSRVVVDRQI